MESEKELLIVEDLRIKLQELNAKYPDDIHFEVLTIVNLDDLACADCRSADRRCVRAVIGFKNKDSSEQVMAQCPYLLQEQQAQ